jgi:hypothetical protein
VSLEQPNFESSFEYWCVPVKGDPAMGRWYRFPVNAMRFARPADAEDMMTSLGLVGCRIVGFMFSGQESETAERLPPVVDASDPQPEAAPAAAPAPEADRIPPLAHRERIVRAAVRFGNAVYSVAIPGRHHHCYALAAEDRADNRFGEDQGFLTSTGRFVDRVEAMLIAVAAGQYDLTRPPRADHVTNPHQLYSEDLW